MTTPVKCLLVDDLDDNLVALSALLRRDDVEVLCAHSGAEALELLLLHDVALAFLDVQMPEMGGFELAELMRGSERTRHIPIIFVTAGARDQHRLFKGYETGAVDFLYKPVDPYILKNKADVFFQLYRQKQELADDLRERTETLRLNEMFIAVLGHDLRNPLNAILMSAHLLNVRGDDQVIKETAGRMLSSGKRMARLIDDILDLARARLGGGIALKHERVNFGAIVRRVVAEQQSAFPDRSIEITEDGEMAGEWDAGRMAQVVSNLLGNALQHGDGRGLVRVRVDGRQADSLTCLIENSGRIPEDVLAHVFDPFRGGHRQPSRTEGLGLGLYIVKQIVNAHRGTVDVMCADDNRTVFRVVVPRSSGVAAEISLLAGSDPA